MARPIKEGLDYFPHDTDAFNDEKIEILRFRHGAMGYMFYFFHLERIYRSPNAELLVSDAETKQIFARKLAVTEQEYEQILSTCVKYHCFDAERYTKEGILTSNGIQKRASIVIDKRNRMRNLYKENVSDAETKQKLSRNYAETIAESTQSKVKKRKEKNSIKTEALPQFIPLDSWNKWLEHRKKQNKALTKYAKELAIKKLTKLHKEGHNPKDVIENSIENNYQGLFPGYKKPVQKNEFGY